MAGVLARQSVTCALALLLVVASAPQTARALEAFDGRIQLHGFYEMQVRGLNADFAEEIDLAQWYHVINLELEFDILPDGWGPFDLMQAYVRAEGRYDCIYSGGCGIFPSVNTYGNDSQDLPQRLRDGVDDSWAGTIQVNQFDVPPGKVPIVPVTGPNARDPVPWSLLVVTENPLGDKGINPVIGDFPDPPFPGQAFRDRDPCLSVDADGTTQPPVSCTRQADPEFEEESVTDRTNNPLFYDPSVPNFFNSDGLFTYRNICAVNYQNDPSAQPNCIDNRPQRFEVARRQAFPGFDTLFEGGGADREIGVNPDFAKLPNASINDLIDNDVDYDSVTSSSYWDPDGSVPDGDDIRDDFTSTLSRDRFNLADPGSIDLPPKSEQDVFRDSLYGPLFRGIARLRDDPAFYTFESIFDWRFTFRSFPGGEGALGQVLPMGPWLPKNFFSSTATLVDRANPLRGRRTPTFVFRNAVADPLASLPDRVPQNQELPRLGGIRYHELDNGTFDEQGNPVDCSAPGTVCDPVDDRIKKVEALTTSLALSALQLPPGGSPALRDTTTGEVLTYPESPFLLNTAGQRFGGDFSGIIPCYPTSTELRVGAFRRFSQQILGQTFNPGCIPYTNIQVTGGTGELPFRAAPELSNLTSGDLTQARGLFFPSAGLVRSFDELEYDHHEFNISEIERSFNRGASQQDTYELKEAYADLEFFDSRLWIRAGLQNIVWGKTELFRTTDQFNPQDLALASLPSLEESRIALLSARAVWSFYDVGPLEDVRLELAANFDRFKPADLGGCGEPYTIDFICALTLGTAIHGVTGIGVSGFDRPPAGWEDIDGVEFGGRIEFRWDRFSFAITDFYGYNDFPYPEPVFFYDRKIDFTSGRPVKALASSGCVNGAGILIQNPFENPVADVNGDSDFNVQPDGSPRVTKLVHAGTPAQYDQGQESPEQYRTVGERELAPSELYSTEFGVDLVLVDPNEELARVGANDDYWRRLEASTILGAGVDPGCLKPGGPAGSPSENRFDERKYAAPGSFPLYSNFTTDEVTNIFDDANSGSIEGDADTFINVTYGQWQRDGFSVDPSLAYHPANQQLFHFICSGTVGIGVALAPNACAWNLFGIPVGFLAGEAGPNFAEVVSNWLAGEPTYLEVQSLVEAVLANTKSGGVTVAGGSVPFTALNSDIRDGRTDSQGSANNIGGSQLASFTTETRFVAAANNDGRFPSIDCPGPAAGSLDDPELGRELSRGTCLKRTARDPWDYLGLGNTLTMEQKALLGCGPFFGTRCGSSEQVVAIRYLENQTQSYLPVTLAGGRGYCGTGANTGDPNCPPVPEAVSVRGGTYDVAGVVFARSVGLFTSGNAVPVKVEAVGKDVLDPEDVCEFDALDDCTIYGEGGGIDFLNMEGSVLVQAFPGIEGTTLGGRYVAADTPTGRRWVPGSSGDSRTWSLDPQPATTGIPGLTTRVTNPDFDSDLPVDENNPQFFVQRVEDPVPFQGGSVCTRYDPGNPLADASGLVKLPGCRGAAEVVINDDLQTVDVVFERGYTPRQDGCVFQRAVRLENAKTRPDGTVIRGSSFYYVRPVMKDRFIQDANGNATANQALDVKLANELAESCWNGGAYANILGTGLSDEARWNEDEDPRDRQPTEFYLEPLNTVDDEGNPIVDGWVEGNVGNEAIRNPRQYDPTFFSYTRRQVGCPQGNRQGEDAAQTNRCRLWAVQMPSTTFSTNWRGLPTAAPFSVRNTRAGFLGIPRDERVGFGGQPNGATNVNELFHLSNGFDEDGNEVGINENGSIFVPGALQGQVTAQSIIGAGTLFHPFAMCSVASFRDVDRGFGGGGSEWVDPEENPETSLACNFRTRDYENDLLNQNAQVFQNELAAMSWNFMLFLATASCNDVSAADNLDDPDCFKPTLPYATNRCSLSTPHLCRNVKGFLAVNGVGRNDVRAGGNPQFGRRDFIWHTGGEVALRYQRRNVFGVSADFAEDVTKTNWGMEFTYIGKVPFVDNDSFGVTTDSSAVNLTISVDRPTFINFLNANRTFFMNTQWFFQYLPNYGSNFTAPGPFNALFTFAVFTGYYQDRLLPQFVSVYDFRTQSGGFLPQLSYRFTEAFSMTFGVSWFIGKNDYVTMPINEIAPVTNRAGRRAYQNGNEQLLSLIRRRDEAFLRLRWTF